VRLFFAPSPGRDTIGPIVAAEQLPPQSESDVSPTPRWIVAIAILAVAGLYAALPASLSVGPRWLFPAIVATLLVPSLLAHWRGSETWNNLLGYVLAGFLTLFLVWSLILLIIALPAHTEAPVTMLRSAVALWWTNVLVFALWYWRLDAGGPYKRDEQPGHRSGSFLFPQMTLDDPNWRSWSPHFVDYLFLAFNTSTAFSPTDVPVLSRWAKVLTMVQSSISLTVIAILAARAVNIL
jgi:hypothetical protein